MNIEKCDKFASASAKHTIRWHSQKFVFVKSLDYIVIQSHRISRLAGHMRLLHPYSAFKINIIATAWTSKLWMYMISSLLYFPLPPHPQNICSSPHWPVAFSFAKWNVKYIWVTNIWSGEEGHLIVFRKQLSQRIDRGAGQCFIVFPCSSTLCSTGG